MWKIVLHDCFAHFIVLNIVVFYSSTSVVVFHAFNSSVIISHICSFKISGKTLDLGM